MEPAKALKAPRPGAALLLTPLLAWTLALLLAWPARADQIVVGAFSQGDLTGWHVKQFQGLTSYSLVEDEGRTVLKAHSRATASALIKEVKLDLKRYPLLRWSWKIERTIAQGDERTKQGDDYAARVYVVFPSAFFWRIRALNYIWANLLPQGQHLPNAFTANAMMLAVESGPAQAGRWISEERNVYDDYRRLFGSEASAAGAVAVMTDTDNTGGEAVAFYGDISLAAQE